MTAAGLAAALCEGRNHDHEWAICYDSQRLAEFVSARLPSPETTPAGDAGLDVERLAEALAVALGLDFRGPWFRRTALEMANEYARLVAALPQPGEPT